jgi:hypothetical protein
MASSQHRLTANAGFRRLSDVSTRMWAQVLADRDAHRNPALAVAEKVRVA